MIKQLSSDHAYVTLSTQYSVRCTQSMPNQLNLCTDVHKTMSNEIHIKNHFFCKKWEILKKNFQKFVLESGGIINRVPQFLAENVFQF